MLGFVSTCLMQPPYIQLEKKNINLLKIQLSLVYTDNITDIHAVSQEKAVKMSLDFSDASKVKTKKRMETYREGEKVPLFRPFFICLKKQQEEHRLILHFLLPFHPSASPYSSGNVRKEPQSRQKFLAGESPSGKQPRCVSPPQPWEADLATNSGLETSQNV